MNNPVRKYDFAIIGAGVVGAWISFELSKYCTSVCVLEKENDCAMGTSKANSAIVHAGYDPMPGTLMARLNVRGNELIRKYAKKMSIPFRQTGSLVVASNDEGMLSISRLYERGISNGVPELKLLNGTELRELEPNASSECNGALFAPTAGICSSFDLTAAPLEIAVANGVDLYRNFKVETVSKTENGFLINGKTEAKYIINAAGLYADEVAALFGDRSFKLIPIKGEYSILDKKAAGIVSRVVFQPPTASGKGILVSQTVDGNILIGPNSHTADTKDDLSTTPNGQNEIFAGAALSVQGINRRDTITSFSGERAVSDKNDFIIGFSETVSGLFNVAGICSPGLTSAPAIAEYTVGLLSERGFLKKKKESFFDSREVIRLNELSFEDRKKLISENPLYGRIICRCETVSEGEIIDSIRRPAGATDLDGIKRRTRAGMGRCQGGFCSPRVMAILADELNVSVTEVTKFGRDSKVVIKKGWDESDS